MHKIHSRGFTIIEIMIGVAIVAILGAVALPQYRSFVATSKVPAGLDALSSVSTRMEQYYQDRGNYGNNGTCGNGMVMPTPSNYDQVTCALQAVNGVAGQGFKATVNGSAAGGLGGYTYSVDYRGRRATEAHPKGANANCWTVGGTKCDS
jgi:prepilin-type N-terminal cleavage/methylation domain-containing protein